MDEILAIIPAFNEEVSIGSVVLRCRDYVDQVLVVDDGSRDRTGEVAEKAQALLFRHERNLGKGMAIQSGLRFARRHAYDVVVLLDGDGQHDPSQIPSLVAPILRGEADLVLGARSDETTDMPLYRRVGARVLDYATALGTGGRVTDSQCGFRALSGRALKALDLTEPDFGVEAEMVIDAKAKGLRVVAVPVTVRYDVDGSTKGPLRHGFGVLDSIIRVVAVRRPLFFVSLPGFVLFMSGFYLGIRTLSIFAQTKTLAMGYSLLVVVLLLLGSLGLFFGLLLNVLPKLVSEVLRSEPVGEAHEGQKAR